MKAPPLVVVTWNDAWSSQAGHDADEIENDHKPHVNYSAGFLVKADRVGVTIAGCYDVKSDAPSYDRVLFVPRGMVKSVRKLK